MIQSERRIYLIRELLNEQPDERDIQIPTGKQEQKNLLRSLFNIRMPKPISADFLKIQDEYLQEEITDKGITDIADLTPIRNNLYLWQGAIVNAANSGMLGCFCPCHGCIDNAIHTYAGVQLRAACADLMNRQGREEETGRQFMPVSIPAKRFVQRK
ncbi:MAG: macro domain-containing protein [Blautia sp.]|nr:macro domain-containing protein [Blautia sp.]